MPTPTKTKRIDVKYLIWEALLEVRFYKTFAVADIPDAEVLKGGNTTLCYRKRKVTGAEYEALLSLEYEDEIADFFGYRSRQ